MATTAMTEDAEECLEQRCSVKERSGCGSKGATIFIEARLKDDATCWDPEMIEETLKKHLLSTDTSFQLGEDILAEGYRAKLVLGGYYQDAQYSLESLKVVEYVGPKTSLTCFSSDDVEINIHVYQLTTDSIAESEALPQAEISIMPHLNFHGQWDELVLEAGLKENLIWMMTNMLRFSRQSSNIGDINPLILLHGPPGTGKTTLAQGLAQKISIRLNFNYNATKLIQIKTTTLLSKYYSESAKQVDEIFRAIESMCKNRKEFLCVLIDEVESIANCRRSSTKNGEAQDSLRATNALLTGLDRAKKYANVIFICTSNMIESLDIAFLDRCCLKVGMSPPSINSQYTILRSKVQKLIDGGIIASKLVLPSYWDAFVDFHKDDLPGSKLLRIVHLINPDHAKSKPDEGISGRRLTQLPELALLLFLRGEDCNLDMALGFIEDLVIDEQKRTRERQKMLDISDDSWMSDESQAGLVIQGRKRKLKVLLEEDCDKEAVHTAAKLITILQDQRQRKSRQV